MTGLERENSLRALQYLLLRKLVFQRVALFVCLRILKRRDAALIVVEETTLRRRGIRHLYALDSEISCTPGACHCASLIAYPSSYHQLHLDNLACSRVSTCLF